MVFKFSLFIAYWRSLQFMCNFLKSVWLRKCLEILIRFSKYCLFISPHEVPIQKNEQPSLRQRLEHVMKYSKMLCFFQWMWMGNFYVPEFPNEWKIAFPRSRALLWSFSETLLFPQRSCPKHGEIVELWFFSSHLLSMNCQAVQK